MQQTNLSTYNNSWYNPGASFFIRVLWYLVNACFFNGYFPFSEVKTMLLRLFGAKVGKNVAIKPGVNIKYPWKLQIGNNVWIGEKVWIDNLAKVNIANDVCISQGAMLLCGNHNYKKSTFDLITMEIHIEEGAWIGAKSVVCPGVVCHNHSVLAVGSVAINNLEAYTVYQGNPAVKVRERLIKA